MAVNKLVDSQQLDSAMTATADAIRAKTGSGDRIEWNNITGFKSAIANIVDLTTYASNIQFNGVDFISLGIENLNVLSTNNNGLSLKEFGRGVNVKTVTITAPNITSPHYGFLYSTVEEITFNSGTGSVSGEFQSFLQNATKAKKVLGSPLDLYTSSNTNSFYQASALEEVRFVENRITNSLNLFQSDLLSDASCISIANGLRSDVSNKTLTLSNAVKARLASIIGSVSDGLFVKNEQATVTLLSFIVDTKGWTVA